MNQVAVPTLALICATVDSSCWKRDQLPPHSYINLRDVISANDNFKVTGVVEILYHLLIHLLRHLFPDYQLVFRWLIYSKIKNVFGYALTEPSGPLHRISIPTAIVDITNAKVKCIGK